MFNKKIKINNYSKPPEFSNFVVDLRRLTTVSINKKEKLIKKQTRLISFKGLVKPLKIVARVWHPELIEKGIVPPKRVTTNRATTTFIYRAPCHFWQVALKIIQKKFNYQKYSLLNIFRNKARVEKQAFFKNFKKNKPWYFFRSHSQRHPWLAFIKKQERVLSSKPLIKKKRYDYSESVWWHSVLAFAIVLVLIILPFKVLSHFKLANVNQWRDQILNHSGLAVNSLIAATNSVSRFDFKNADSEFQTAGANFLAASGEVAQINDTLLKLASFSGDPRLKLAAESKKFLQAGALVSSLGRNLTLASESLFANDDRDFAVTLDNFLNYGQAAAAEANSLKKILARINVANLPVEYQSKFVSLSNQANLLADNLVEFVRLGEKFKEVLGLSQDKRYLFVFQNNAELRASGGFLGSYALIDLRDGQIRNLEVPGGGSYDTEGSMSVRLAAPKPLWLVNPIWHFWDANWWPDWPTTARNLMWFYEHSGGPSVDGVISVTPTVVEKLLELSGPIDMTQEYGVIIDANNFWQTVQIITEQDNLIKTHPEVVADLPTTTPPVVSSLPIKQGLDLNSANKPKKIIGDLMAKILETLPSRLNKDSLLKMLILFEQSMSEKQILTYFVDSQIQAAASTQNWTGEVKAAEQDYLLIVHSNIAGQKTDRSIDEKIEQLSEVAPDGSIINTLNIIRTHNGIKREALTGVRNVDWLRIYVPRGSELLMATGFKSPDSKYLQKTIEGDYQESSLLTAENEAISDPQTGTKIYEEFDKTVFANWLMIDPGETITITVKYRLPFNLLNIKADNSWLQNLNNWLNPEATKLLPYSLLVQKQPGAKASTITSQLKLPKTWRIFWSYPEEAASGSERLINDELNADKYWPTLIEPNKR